MDIYINTNVQKIGELLKERKITIPQCTMSYRDDIILCMS